MSDIVRRLRENAEIVPDDTYTWFNPLLNEAADEIERLQADRDEWKFGCELRSQTASDRLDSLKKLTAVIEQLRAALKAIADYSPGKDMASLLLRNYARDALERKGPGK